MSGSTGAPPLDGHVALVTGANHGIGAAVALALARRGADVLVTYLRADPDHGADVPDGYGEARRRDAAEVVAAVEGCGRRCRAVEANLSDAATPALLFDVAEEQLGAVDILVNNASGWSQDSFTAPAPDAVGRPTLPVSAETFEGPFAVDARAAALLMAEFARRHRARGATWGRIVGLTSGGPDGMPGEVSYGAAKAALEHLTKSAAVELAGDGITANCVYPPVTDTGWVTDAVRRFVAASTDHMHVASPAEVAEVVAWLCTDAAHLVTGNVIRLR